MIASVKNGPALGGYGALSMNEALARTMTTMPEQLRRSLTWDRGKELSAHAAFTVEAGTAIYFADPHSPWQRGTNENTKRSAAAVLPQGDRSVPPGRGRPRGRRARAQQQTAQDARLEDTGRSDERLGALGFARGSYWFQCASARGCLGRTYVRCCPGVRLRGRRERQGCNLGRRSVPDSAPSPTGLQERCVGLRHKRGS